MAMSLAMLPGSIKPERNGSRVLCYIPSAPYAYRWQVMIVRHSTRGDEGRWYFDDDSASSRMRAAMIERWAYLPESTTPGDVRAHELAHAVTPYARVWRGDQSYRDEVI